MGYAKTSERAEQRELREKMRAMGISHREIVAEFTRRYNFRPRAAWRQAHGLSLRDAAARINTHTGETGIDPTGIAGMTGAHLCEYENWPGYGDEPTGRKPTPYLLSLLAAIYGCEITELIDLTDRQHLSPADLLILDKYSQPAVRTTQMPVQAAGSQQELPSARQRMLRPGIGEHPGEAQFSTLRQPPAAAGTESVIRAVADESADYAFAEAARSVAPLGVIHLIAELQRLARSYSAMPPLEFLGQARNLRDESRRLSERTRKPRQLADLHVVTGGACALLAMASWDLGAWSAAIEQAHAAGMYGQIAGHPGLQAWAAGCEGLIVFWRGRPREAADVIATALEFAPRGTARARLHCIAARAWAYLGAMDRVRSELAAAGRAQDESGDAHAEELHDKIGGEYGWDRARHAMCAATALLIVGDPAAAAIRAREAIALEAAGHAFGDLVGAKAQADLACVELSRGRLDAAGEALNPVWQIAPDFRSYPLIGRLENVSAGLEAQRYACSRAATDLAERIRAFSAESAPALAVGGVLPPCSQ